MKKLILLGILTISILISTAQSAATFNTANKTIVVKEVSSTQFKKWKPFIIPSVFIGYGFAGLGKDAPFNIDLNFQHSSQNHLDINGTKLDNYIQFVPALSVYALDALSVKPQHSFWLRTKIFITANALMFLSVFPLKNISNVKRPDNSAYNSFPSGHAATAFLGADFFYNEFKYKNEWWIYSGYFVATVVAVLRIINNAHWLSDVVAGAGLGILSNRVSYLIFNRNKSKTNCK